jgi:ubiquitin-conjugating enzyme E2 Q
MDDAAKSSETTFRVGLSNSYKPTLTEALAAFTEISKDGRNLQSQDTGGFDELTATRKAGFSSIFISSSLNELINSRFISLLKIRNTLGLGWDGAKSYFSNNEGRMDCNAAELPSEYYVEPAPSSTTLPDLVTSDHLTDHQVKRVSFPLIAIQFTLRYLSRCTEFCLVCHDRIKEDFEALKPYVCEKPLCLYQYMNLGFGPSVEHEILTQPYVVDLLVSFCYIAAMVSLSFFSCNDITYHKNRVAAFGNIQLA